MVLDHADPAGQHAVILDTVESLEHAVVENILDGRPMEGITCPELLEHSLRLLDTTLDGGLVDKILDWEPDASPVPDTTLDGGGYLPGAFGSGGVSGQWTHGGDVEPETIAAVGS